MENTMMPEFIEVGATKYISEEAVDRALAELREKTVRQLAAVTLSNLLDDLEDFLNQQRRSLNMESTSEESVEEPEQPIEESEPVADIHPNKRGKTEINDAETQKAIVDEYFSTSLRREDICKKYHISETTMNRYISRYANGRTKMKGARRKFVPHAPADTRPITQEEYDEIKTMYEKGGVTQKELAEMFDLSTWRISNICRGLPTFMVEEFYNSTTIDVADFNKWNKYICDLAKSSAVINGSTISDILKDAYGVMNTVYGICWAQEKNPATKNLLSSILANTVENKEN